MSNFMPFRENTCLCTEYFYFFLQKNSVNLQKQRAQRNASNEKVNKVRNMLRFSFFRSGGGDWGISPGASHMLWEQSQRYGPRHPIFFFCHFLRKDFMCMSVSSSCKSVHIVHVWCPQKRIRFPRTGVMGGSEPPCRCWK